MKPIALIRDLLIIVVLAAVVIVGALYVKQASAPVPAPAVSVPPLPVDRCGGGMCQR